MNSIEMVSRCAERQPLCYEGVIVKVAKCVGCQDDVLYTWYRNGYCSLCDMKRELRGEAIVEWEPPENTQDIDLTRSSES